MSCEEFWESGLERLDHLRECPACAGRCQRDARLVAGLKALGAQLRRVEAPARVERRLVEVFRGRAAGPARWREVWAPLFTWGTAVAATVTLALLLVHGRQAPPTYHSTRSTVELAALETSDAEGMPVETVATPSDGEAEFIPLPNAEEVSPNEEVDVVRVEVPRSAMIALGFPLDEGQASDEVEAEVALGPDGLARAVRFLDE